MKSTRAAQISVDVSNLSIPDAEEIIEEALNETCVFYRPRIGESFAFAPPGYQAIVELCSENGRSKRRSSSADAWSPEEDEVRIYFERSDDSEQAPRQVRAPRVAHEHSLDEEEDSQEAVIPADLEARVKETLRSTGRS